MTTDVFIADAVRTPIGRYNGGLASVRPDDLAAAAVRRPDRAPRRVRPVAHRRRRSSAMRTRPARTTGTSRGWPHCSPGSRSRCPARRSTACAARAWRPSIDASRAIAVGDASICIAGGVESMTRAPWVLLKPDARSRATTRRSARDARLADGEPGDAGRVDGLARRGGRAPRRPLQDHARGAGRLRARSHTSERPRHGTEGEFADEVVLVPDGADIERTRWCDRDTSLEKLAKLRPVFRPDGTVTAGNSSPLNDGAAALFLADELGLDAIGAEPLARIAGRAVSAASSRSTSGSDRSRRPRSR